MILPRIIPILLLVENGLVKTKKFKDPVYIGDPINAVRIFNEKEVDELIILNIHASKYGIVPNFKEIEEIVSESFMPLGYGGGLTSLEDVKKVFDTGIEKVIICSAMFDYKFIEDISKIYGSQSVVVSLDVKKNIFGKYNIYTTGGTKKSNISIIEHLRKLEYSGVGELIIQSIDKEGTMEGYDTNITKIVSDIISIPVVGSGGAGKLAHIKEVIDTGGASAAAAGSIFVFKGSQKGVLINYPSRKKIEELFSSE
jgi:cyclase